MKYIVAVAILIIVGLNSQSAFCQIDRGGVPRSFNARFIQKSLIQPIEIPSPDLIAISKEDDDDARLEKPYRVGVEVPVSISPETYGQWDNLPDGGKIWRAVISCKGATGIGFNYSNLRLPAGTDLFVYTPDHSEIIGALTSAEISDGAFTTRPLRGDELIIEFYSPGSENESAVIDISGVVYMYRGFEPQLNGISSSSLAGSCEVNINCAEGQNWQKQKRGVVKILTKVGLKTFYCTGVLVNNTLQDFSGLLLTAGHCSEDNGSFSSTDDFKHWVFYFNYEYAGCPSTGTKTEYSIVGAQKLATSAGLTDFGSDFLLMKSLSTIPANYNPYFCGWDAGNDNSTSGVCIHHPDGDVKKISTYSTLLQSGSWATTPNTHWIVQWAQTTNGYGVTEGGSSGSPLFDDEGLVIGTLSGGPSSCSNTSGEDMFGKIPYSWVSNGNLSSQQLKPWLDPGNTGIVRLPGAFNTSVAVADFSSNRKVAPAGGSINFYDLSSGKPTKWHWYFWYMLNGKRIKVSESALQNPSDVVFDSYGKMNVSLVVDNGYNTDSLCKENFIDIRAVVSPNPCFGELTILTDINNTSNLTIEVFDAYGKKAQQYSYSGSSSSSYTIKLPDYGNLFFLRIIQGNQVQTHKVVVVH